MAEFLKRQPGADLDNKEECGVRRSDRGERGERGRRGPEGPEGPAGPAGGGASDLIAAARIAGPTGAILSGFGIAASVHPETGLYRLTLCDPPRNDDDIILSVTVKQASPGAMVTADVVMGGFVEVRLADCGCASMDQDFFVLAFDGNPKCKPKCGK